MQGVIDFLKSHLIVSGIVICCKVEVIDIVIVVVVVIVVVPLVAVDVADNVSTQSYCRHHEVHECESGK